MVLKTFHLLGRDAGVENNLHLVDIDGSLPFSEAQSAVADALSVVETEGVELQVKGKQLVGVDEILASQEPIAVTVDGHAVRPVPEVKGLPFIGTYMQIYPDHLGNHQRLFHQYGPVIKHTDMGHTIHLTNDPNVAYHALQESPFFSKVLNQNHPLTPLKNQTAGLFVSDTNTEAWRVVHKFVAPSLSPKAVRHYTPMMQATAQSSFPIFDELDKRENSFNVFSYMFKMASQAVAELALGMDLKHFEAIDSPVHPMVSDMADILELNKKVGAQHPWISHMPIVGSAVQLDAKQADFKKWITTSADAAKARHAGEPDLPIIDAALKAECIADYVARAIDENGNKLPDKHFLPAMTVVLGAGFTTTACLTSWLIYGLVTYEGTQARLLQELADHGVTSDTKWTFDTTNDLPYLDKFIKEIQRLHNPAHQPARTALRDMILPGGYFLKEGDVLTSAIRHIHTNPKVWDNVDRFDPDRWDSEKVKNRPKGSFIPFATGPRSCIGFNFALQEVKTIIPTLLWRYEFERVGDDAVEYDPFFQLIRPINLYVRFKRRTSWPKPANKQEA